MKGTNLGEFEELILLVVGVLFPDAYGLSIRSAVIEQTGRNVAIDKNVDNFKLPLRNGKCLVILLLMKR